MKVVSIIPPGCFTWPPCLFIPLPISGKALMAKGQIIRPEKFTGLIGHYRPYQSVSLCEIGLIYYLFR